MTRTVTLRLGEEVYGLATSPQAHGRFRCRSTGSSRPD